MASKALGLMSRHAHGLLSANRLHKAYDSHTVLEDVSFDIQPGEFVTLLGASGAGKTTLVRCLAGLTPLDSGHIQILGRPLNDLKRSERSRIAVVFQQFNLVSRLTALENVLAGRLGQVPVWRGILRQFSGEDTKLALTCLERVGLLNLASQRADRLSGGQQQRVAIARALAQQAQVILADEPIASLDPQASADVLELLKDICRQNSVAVICSLHQVEFAKRYADRIIAMQGGRVLLDIAASEFNDKIENQVYRADRLIT